MDTFSIIRNALAASENDPDKVGLAQDVIDTARVVAAVQVVVDALTPPDGGRYIVGFKDIQTAGTSLADHRIVVSSKPLRDPDLTLVEKAVVIATFAAHEIGHTYVTRPRRYPVDVVKAHNEHTGFHSVANIADDIILEPFMVERYPILQDAFDFTGSWVLRNTAESLPVTHDLHHGTSAAERFNIILSATRYGDIPEIVWTEGKMCDERDWARDWKTRLLALPLLDHDGFVAACDEVWERIRIIDDEPEPIIDEPEPLDDNPNGTNDDEDEDEPEGDDESEPPVTCGPTEPTDEKGDPEPGEGEPEPTDEKGDEPDWDKQGDDFDEDREDEPSEDPKGDGDEEKPEPDEPTEGGDEPTESGDDEDDESEDGDEGDGDTESDDDGDDSDDVTDEKVEHRDENDFNSAEVDKTTHDQAEQTNYDGDQIERSVRTYSNTTSVRFGQHGSMTTTWD